VKAENIKILKDGGVGIIPTDTIYGLVGRAFLPEAVGRIAKLKNRSDGKGFIVLISSLEDLEKFGVIPTETAKIFLKKFWPGQVSVEFISSASRFDYLKKIGGTIAFRVPNKPDLLELLRQTGPLVAPSANPEGLPPAKNIPEAQKYFGLPGQGGLVDFYEDEGELNSPPSTLIRIVGEKVEVLREGAVKI